MTQASITPPAYPTSKSGTDLASDLSAQSGAINSTHQGDTSPTYAKEGLVWSGKNGRVCRKLSSGDCIIGHRPITSLADLRNFGEGQRDEDVVRISIGDTVYFYFWDADSTAADNDSTIIRPSGWATAGRWVRLNSGATGGTADWTEEPATVLFGGSDYFEVFGDKTDIYEVDRALRLTQTTSGIGYVASVVLNGGNTVVKVKGITVDAGLTKVEYGIEVGSQSYIDIPDIVFASEAEAKAGTGTTQVMNPSRTAQAIVALGRMDYVSSSASANAVKNTYYRIASSSARTVTLPDSATLSGGEVIGVSRVGTGKVTIQSSGSDVIENALTSMALAAQGDACLLYCDKSQNRWKVVYMPISTTPADPYGVSSITSWPGVYTGSDAGNLTYPIGTTVFTKDTAAFMVNRNAAASLYLVSGNAFYFSSSVDGTALTGTWRGRGNALNGYGGLMQRTA